MKSKVKKRCFVIMPFTKTSEKHTDEYWTNHYETFLKPLIESNHPLIAERSSPLRGDILKQIITDLVTAPVVIADITDANPNVYWELGVRQSFMHCTITIAESKTVIPFDLGVKATLFYFPDNHIKMQEFMRKFHQAINDCLANPNLPDSHVLETIGGRGTLHQIISKDESLRRLEAIVSEIEDNLSVLDFAFSNCKKNIELRKSDDKKPDKEGKITYTSRRFRIMALEALITNRYINADNAFYNKMEICMDWLQSFNETLISWQFHPETMEQWIMETHDNARTIINGIKTLVNEQQDKLRSLL